MRNYPNLAGGLGRRLRFDAKIGNEAAVEEAMVGVVRNFARDVRNEVLNDMTVYLEKRAVHYIEEGRLASKVPVGSPRSEGLSRSFQSFGTEQDKMTVTMGDGISYARLHNLMPGETREIYPQNGRLLLFYWYREQMKMAATVVRRSGVGYWTRALKDTALESDKIVKKWIRYFAKGDATIHRRTGARLRGASSLVRNAKQRSSGR